LPPVRSRHERISDAVWGAPDPSPEDRKQLELIRQSARDGGRQVEDIAMRELEAKGVGPGTMARTTPSASVASARRPLSLGNHTSGASYTTPTTAEQPGTSARLGRPAASASMKATAASSGPTAKVSCTR
jgi:hypothetical protein